MTPDCFKSIRRALGLSAQGLANALHISSGRTVRHWESGTRPITGPVGLLMRYFQKYGLPNKALDDRDERAKR